ncbi:hypothetical protein DPMN_038887 [Dreissena polymorpha]|uniref:Uncharacterized protein n=1 Tax=Dreissena polymorpha TaxID=45954 RepID=A0A9D4MG57_DREPO|nr:hypothetical protein DPMN_038887 [Dreissena polymorpha]
MDPNSIRIKTAGYTLENVKNRSNFGKYQQGWQHLKMSRMDSNSVSINMTCYTLANVQNGSLSTGLGTLLKIPKWIHIRSVSTRRSTPLHMFSINPSLASFNRTGYTLANVQNGSNSVTFNRAGHTL